MKNIIYKMQSFNNKVIFKTSVLAAIDNCRILLFSAQSSLGSLLLHHLQKLFVVLFTFAIICFNQVYISVIVDLFDVLLSFLFLDDLLKFLVQISFSSALDEFLDVLVLFLLLVLIVVIAPLVQQWRVRVVEYLF